MKKIKKLGADAVQEAALGNGHNSDELLKGYVEKIAKYSDSMDGIRGKIKELLNAAKTDGFLKTAIRKAIKDLRMTEEQRQAANEIEVERKRYVEICREVGLFIPEGAEAA